MADWFSTFCKTDGILFHLQLFIVKTIMESYVITKKQLLEFINDYNKKKEQIDETINVRVKKEDVEMYGKDENYKAWVRLIPTPDEPIETLQPKIVRVTPPQFSKILDYVTSKEEMKRLP